MRRILGVTLLLAAMPVLGQGILGYRAAYQGALRCVHAAVSDPSPHAGTTIVQVADAAIWRCTERIDAAARAAIEGSEAALTEFEPTRAALRKEFRDYALQIAGGRVDHTAP